MPSSPINNVMPLSKLENARSQGEAGRGKPIVHIGKYLPGACEKYSICTVEKVPKCTTPL